MVSRMSESQAKAIFRAHGGMLRTSEALRLGIHPRVLYALRDRGVLDPIERGLYRLAELPPLAHPDLVVVASKMPKGVVCLISALAFHEITTQVPHEVYVAIEQKQKRPRLRHPPIRVSWFSGPAFSEGIESHRLDGTDVRIYSPEKTVADCFRHRGKVGLDTAIEALRLCQERLRCSPRAIMHFARVCRVQETVRPYLEALL